MDFSINDRTASMSSPLYIQSYILINSICWHLTLPLLDRPICLMPDHISLQGRAFGWAKLTIEFSRPRIKMPGGIDD